MSTTEKDKVLDQLRDTLMSLESMKEVPGLTKAKRDLLRMSQQAVTQAIKLVEFGYGK